jgi:hypothetical protein
MTMSFRLEIKPGEEWINEKRTEKLPEICYLRVTFSVNYFLQNLACLELEKNNTK